ncbi:MAG: ribosome biogenesis/translation initiation ATPase RLI [Candidatus Micrarchaeia archaeon]
MRIAVINRKKCTKERCGYLCISVCPGVRMGEETIVKDAEGFPVISEALCTGCGICVKKCPFGAIKVINLVGERGLLIHQYGLNSFRLFNLPIPQKDGVVGLIGANGIGKTTALRILSGEIKPNMGGKCDDGEFIRMMKPEMQNYFRGLLEKGVRVSYKPQNVDRIPEFFKGKVGELLKKCDGRGVLEHAIEIFELEGCVDKSLGELSGGELQRVAICAAYVKDADIYFFDEPTSYLDIEQRLSVAKNIKELAEERRVIVVEHDLAVLDYLSDFVYIFYGVPEAYGVVSGLKGVRAGINEYLEGYLHEENVRFRDYEIKFELAPTDMEKASGEIMMKWNEMEKRLGSFVLSCRGGEIKEGEVVGIVGRNAIGKSTFVNLLAGVYKPDVGYEVEKSFSISYKPQYVRLPKGSKVAELFENSGVDRDIFDRIVRDALEVGGLMESYTEHMSGGEAQRVAIALCLSKKADIYLLDEPSAFLDVEQRLRFADAVKKAVGGSEKCAFIVDHDLVLIDAVSSRMVVFEGEPGKKGIATSPRGKREGMNAFLSHVGITLRRDKDSLRPRVNKPGSALDREQKEVGEYYYYKRD